MPVFWFALSFVEDINWGRAIFVFLILHLLVYPSSNGYNSYMDRDEGSIGGIEKPPMPTMELFWVTLVMDIVAIAVSIFVSPIFALCIGLYIIFSRLYSYRPVRLKKYPIIGYITVIFNQGSLIFFAVYHGCNATLDIHVTWVGLITAAFLIGGFYPITQVYQHKSDAEDNVTTISMLLGIRGTFVFCAVMYTIALVLLSLKYTNQNTGYYLIVLILFFLPVVLYFLNWFKKILQNENAADYQHTMTLNKLASTCTSLSFLSIILIKQFV